MSAWRHHVRRLRRRRRLCCVDPDLARGRIGGFFVRLRKQVQFLKQDAQAVGITSPHKTSAFLWLKDKHSLALFRSTHFRSASSFGTIKLIIHCPELLCAAWLSVVMHVA